MRSNRLLFVRPTFCHHKRQEDVGDSIETIHIFLNWEKTKLLKISLYRLCTDYFRQLIYLYCYVLAIERWYEPINFSAPSQTLIYVP